MPIRTIRTLSAIGLLLLALAAANLTAPHCAQGAQTQVVDRIVAVVNGQIITLYELNKRFAPVMERFEGRELGQADEQRLETMRAQLLDRMINDILLEEEAKRLGLEVSEAEVDNHIRNIRTHNNLTSEQFEEQLKLQQKTLEQYRQEIRRDILIHRLLGVMVRRKVVVTKQEVQEYYEAHKSDYAKDRTVGLSLILLPAGMDAQELKNRIESGELTFAQAAKQFSQGPGADSGGEIGLLPWDQLAPEWREALKNLKQGQVSKPFDLGGRQALLLLNSNSAGTEKAIESVSDEIREILQKPKYEQLHEEYMQRLRENAIIDIKL